MGAKVNNKHTLLSIVVIGTLLGSVFLAIIDEAQRPKFMSIASSSIGAYWALQRPPAVDDTDDTDDNKPQS